MAYNNTINTMIQVHDLHFKPYLSAEQIQAKVHQLGAEISQDYKGKQPLFISILNGAFIFAADLVRACELDCEVAFTQLSSYSGTSSTGKVELKIPLTKGVEGRDIIIVEDIIDTGKTLHFFMEYLQSLKPASITLAALLVKPTAIEYPVKVNYAGFEIPNKFVVGYGLDYNELGRNLADIYQLASAEISA